MTVYDQEQDPEDRLLKLIEQDNNEKRLADHAVGFLRVFHVQAKVAGEMRWRGDVAARHEAEAERLALEFILTEENGVSELAKQNLAFSAERARELREPYGWVIGVRDP